MGKSTDTYIWEVEILAATKFNILSQNLCYKYTKQHRIVDTGFRFHGEFYIEKYSKVFLWNAWNVLMRMWKEEKGQILYIMGGDNRIVTSAKLLDITHESYWFSVDLIEVNN